MPELLYGRHSVLHALEARRRKVHKIFLQSNLEADLKKLPLLKQARCPVEIVPISFFQKKLGAQLMHQGLVAETDPYPYAPADELLQERFLLLLDEVQDTQNLGALCRSAYLFGVGGVVIPETHAAPVTAGTAHASVGAVEFLKIARVSSIAGYLELLKENQFWVYGTDREGTKLLYEETFPNKVALVIGNEEKGLRRLVKERCDILLKIPTRQASVDSLNASVSGGVVMYEVFRQFSQRTC